MCNKSILQEKENKKNRFYAVSFFCCCSSPTACRLAFLDACTLSLHFDIMQTVEMQIPNARKPHMYRFQFLYASHCGQTLQYVSLGNSKNILLLSVIY